MKIYGFTLLRNGVKYDYPFRESLNSLAGITTKIYLSFGNSSDETANELKAFQEKICIIPTIWDENKRSGGEILSEQTNIALTELRRQITSADTWAFYLQADEVLLEDEYDLILADIKKAQEQGCDAIAFRYLHFWQSYNQIAIHKRWYPQEIRAFRLHAPITSYGDAQSFRGQEKVFYSDAHIFHYGHVREKSAYAKKIKDFHRWWHKDEELEKIYASGDKNDKKEKSLHYLGPHPSCMQKRMIAHGWTATPKAEEVFIFGEQNQYSDVFLQKIQAKNTLWTTDWNIIKKKNPKKVVLLQEPSFLQNFSTQFRFGTEVPLQMHSPEARPWTKEFLTTMRFSEKGIAIHK